MIEIRKGDTEYNDNKEMPMRKTSPLMCFQIV